MELHEIPAAFQSKLRLAAIAALMTGPKDFTTLQKLAAATAGNLGKQLEQLEGEGYISARKEFFSRRPRTTYEITPQGRETFLAYVALLESIAGGNK